ncbi:MAG: hypothetical protein GTN62_02475, partial [Gemmatimonadales bacterium]|nr:hypothetical protein [Gemmatimonadales bacterium]NIN10210.1 hypothetical protein [Gemmatimonadales bacterium]NIN48966.1 hypothetical protein [Gemmatimonadales bacterium]NIP06430.1 hypothetical protein [Gemmatimonadales bacterium]NIQ98782.1 hypothetical protein [Gemmatimonadales bacterium]
TFVVGEQDEAVEASKLDELEARLVDRQIPYEAVSFAGGHWLDPDVLRSLAAT